MFVIFNYEERYSWAPKSSIGRRFKAVFYLFLSGICAHWREVELYINADEVIAFCLYLVTKNQDVEKSHYDNVAFVFRLFNRFHRFQIFSYFSISNEGILAKLSLAYNH